LSIVSHRHTTNDKLQSPVALGPRTNKIMCYSSDPLIRSLSQILVLPGHISDALIVKLLSSKVTPFAMKTWPYKRVTTIFWLNTNR